MSQKYNYLSYSQDPVAFLQQEIVELSAKIEDLKAQRGLLKADLEFQLEKIALQKNNLKVPSDLV